MHLLPCPSCQTSLPVSLAQAGESVTCPSCQANVDIPKLGDLRRLPLDQNSLSGTDNGEEGRGGSRGAAADRWQPSLASDRSRWARVGFLIFGLLAAASLLTAGYSAIRWSTSELPATTEEHISTIRLELQTRTAAQLVREYEDMEERGIDLGGPFHYKELSNRRARWARVASVAAGIGTLSLLLAAGIGVAGRRPPGGAAAR